jgi:hypothetical protein
MNAESYMLRIVSLLLLISGTCGMFCSAVLVMSELQGLPRFSNPAERRVIPRDLLGVTVYQTADENGQLTTLENWSAGAFTAGLLLWLLYVQKRGLAQGLGSDPDDAEGNDEENTRKGPSPPGTAVPSRALRH